LKLRFAVPMVALSTALFGQPHLFTAADYTRIEEWSAQQKWASDARAGIISSAQAWPQAYIARYGLTELAIPPEGGQWPHWYVCPVHGAGLEFRQPSTHRCPVDGRNYTGWPYDQVIFSRRHGDLANAARDNALAWRFTGDARFANAAAWILKQYASAYQNYPLKDVNNRPDVRTGARASAQTLDESVWLIPLAWAYDTLSGSDALTAAERSEIEKGLLRAAVQIIQRYDAGISNWQSWHNAAIGAVGFALNDRALIEQAIDGKSGLRFQMKNSVVGEGFWYEGAWSYHFYALDPIVQLAEMAARNGIDAYSESGLRGLFAAPLRLAFANGSLPAFNDSNSVSLFNQARLYEVAYRRYEDPLFAAIARRGARGRDALLFGSPELPAATLGDLTSEVFADSGYAVLRGPGSDHTVIMKFGPHGGGHGHYDKLGMVSYAFGGVMAVDPGTQSYAAPTHATWDKLTVAHNTVVVDETTQREATGKLVWQQLTPEFSAAKADAGPVYPGVKLDRTVLVTAEYALDITSATATDGKPHQLDWVYHNAGIAKTDLPVRPYDAFPKKEGYQHLTSNMAVHTPEAWSVLFDDSPTGTVPVSSVFASVANVSGTFQYSLEQAAQGRFAGRMAYDFRGPGYLLYSTPPLSNQPSAAPTGLRMMIHGDGSGHRLVVRVNDATDERFVVTVGPVNWTGWKQVEVTGADKWQHYLGNNDGIIDAPIRTVSLEFNYVPPGPASGAIYVDDIRVLYPDEDVQALNFELPARQLRLWMLAAPETTVVTGNGLGPDLLKPVPFAMARRSGAAAEFVALLEPFESQPGVVAFRKLEDGTISIQGKTFEDRIHINDSGIQYVRVILEK
jgi:hypothetical protein